MKRCSYFTTILLITLIIPFSSFPILADSKPVVQEKGKKKQEDLPKKEKNETKIEYQTIKPEKKHIRISLSLKGFFEDPDAVPFGVATRIWSDLKVVQPPIHGSLIKKNERVLNLELEKISKKLIDLKHELKILSLNGDILANELKRDEKVYKIELAELAHAEKFNQKSHNHFKEWDLPYQKKSAINELKGYEENLTYVLEELKQLKKMYESDDLTEETEEIIITRTQNDVNRLKFALEGAKIRKNKRLSLEIPKIESDKDYLFEKQNLTLSTERVVKPIALEKKRLEIQKIQENKKNLLLEIGKLEKDYSELKTLSPISGTIFVGTFDRGKWSGLKPFEPKLKRGGILKPYEEFVTICPLKRVHARLNIPQKNYADLTKIKSGVLKSAIAPNTEIICQIDEIAQFPFSPDHYDLTLDVKIPENIPLPLPGTSCTFNVITYEKKNALTLPNLSVFKEDHDQDLRFVYVLSPEGKPIKKSVRVGKISGENIEILSGIKSTQLILKDKPKK